MLRHIPRKTGTLLTGFFLGNTILHGAADARWNEIFLIRLTELLVGLLGSVAAARERDDQKK
jgi:hypothetical protein